MRVSTLIKILEKLPQESIIVLSKDGEGNRYSPLASIEEGLYAKETSWHGDFFYPEDAEEMGYEEDEAEAAIVFWPVN